MGKRFKRSRKGESAVPATVNGGDNLPEETPTPPSAGEVLQSVAVPAFLDHAVDAFEQAFSALYTHAQYEATRLGRTNKALKHLEDKLLNPEEYKEMGPEAQIELMKVLAANKTDSVQVLLAITRNITQTRAVAGILGSLRRMAEVHNAAASIAPGNQETPSTRKVASRP